MLSKLIPEMLKQNTGIALCDSGGENGRKWQQNQNVDFAKEPEVTMDKGETFANISTYHYLVKYAGLALDDVCDKYNALPCEDFDGFAYGVSEDQTKYLEGLGVDTKKENKDFNTVNYGSNLDTILQGTYITINDKHYVLLQTHNGADVRGGYSDAKLFLLQNEWINPEPYIFATIDGKEYNTVYNGETLTLEDGNGEEIPEDYKNIDSLSIEGMEI